MVAIPVQSVHSDKTAYLAAYVTKILGNTQSIALWFWHCLRRAILVFSSVPDCPTIACVRPEQIARGDFLCPEKECIDQMKELPKVYEPQEVESRIYEQWEKNG
ncbi:MAG: hypothetical protein J6Q14_07080, partial [Oscillospiraceae bacterium]|nr:hypothetical protein [Oscillospiraceae bacterium]